MEHGISILFFVKKEIKRGKRCACLYAHCCKWCTPWTNNK